MKKSEIEYYKKTMVNGIYDIQRSVVAGEIYYMRQLTVYDQTTKCNYKSTAFKSRPFLVISSKRNMPYNRTVCVKITSNCTNKYAIPVIISGKVSFIDPLYQCVFVDTDFNKQSYCGSVPPEILSMVKYASMRFVGGKLKTSMEEMILSYQKSILDMVNDKKVSLRKDDGTAKIKLEQIVGGRVDNHDPLGFEMNIKSEDDDVDEEFPAPSIIKTTIRRMDNVPYKLNGTYFLKNGSKIKLKNSKTLSIKEMSDFLDDMTRFKTYTEFVKIFGVTAQTIKNRALSARRKISDQNIEIPKEVVTFMDSAHLRIGGIRESV